MRPLAALLRLFLAARPYPPIAPPRSAIACPGRAEAGCRTKGNKRCATLVGNCSITVNNFCEATYGAMSDRATCNATCGPYCDGLCICGYSGVHDSAFCLLGRAP